MLSRHRALVVYYFNSANGTRRGVTARAAARKIPLFGVCLGLQGTVEAFGRFDPLEVAAYTPDDIERLMADPRRAEIYRGLGISTIASVTASCAWTGSQSRAPRRGAIWS